MKLPRLRITVRSLMVVVAVLGVTLGMLSALHCGPTFYATKFTETQFASLRESMTIDEVKAIMGPPLEVVQQQDGSSLWTYSNRDDYTCDFEMRCVYFQDGKVQQVVNRLWDD